VYLTNLWLFGLPVEQKLRQRHLELPLPAGMKLCWGAKRLWLIGLRQGEQWLEVRVACETLRAVAVEPKIRGQRRCFKCFCLLLVKYPTRIKRLYTVKPSLSLQTPAAMLQTPYCYSTHNRTRPSYRPNQLPLRLGPASSSSSPPIHFGRFIFWSHFGDSKVSTVFRTRWPNAPKKFSSSGDVGSRC